MKITNFRLTEKSKKKCGPGCRFKAVVTIESWFPFKKDKDVEVYKAPSSMHWRFSESGKMTPSGEVENLESAYEAKMMKDLEDCEIETLSSG